MKTIGLVDFSHTLRVNYHVRPEDGAPTQAGAYTLQQLSDWRRGLDHVIVCLDSPPYDRSTAYPEYKAGRARDEGYIQVCKWTKERLVKDGYSIASHPGAEADDVIATLATTVECRDIRIFGGDKDCLQCVRSFAADGSTDPWMVRAFVPAARGDFEVRDAEWVRTKWGVTPEQVPLFLAICGDKSDNILGIPGIGPKGAAELIREYGTIAKMRIAAVAALEESQKEGAKPLAARWKHFLAGSPRLPEWLSLVTLRTDLPLDVDALLVKQKPQPLVEEHGDSWEGPSREELEEERFMMAAEAEAEKARINQPAWRCTSCPERQTNSGWCTECGRCGAKRMLDPEVVISGPKNLGGSSDASTAAPSAEPRTTYAPNVSMPSTSEAKTELPKGTAEPSPYKAPELWTPAERAWVMAQPDARSRFPGLFPAAGPAESTPPARAPSTPPSNGTAPAAKPAPRSDEPGSIVVAGPRQSAPSWALELQPTTIDDAKRAAATLFNARHYMQFEHAPGIFAIILKGRELGVGMMAALEMFYLVKGRPYPSAKGKRFLAERDPNCEWIMVTEADDKSATIKTLHRKAGLLSYTYTIERAEKAGYLTGGNKHNWNTIRQEMLEARATSKGVDRWYSGATFGMPAAEDVQNEGSEDDE